MSDITVRKVRFEFPESLDGIFPGDDLMAETHLVAFSLTMPHLEPYLIRTYRQVLDRITDPALAEDVRAFIGQEAQHHRNHSRANDVVKRLVGNEAGSALQAIEDELEADYRRFTDTKSMRFNLTYAEGFEAMTCAWALTQFEEAAAGRGIGSGSAGMGAWQQLWAWHAAEEVEHRTVAFGVYEHLCGGYLRRSSGSLRAQVHFLRYIKRFQQVLLAALDQPTKTAVSPLVRSARYRRTFLPGYDPAPLDPGPIAALVLQMYGRPADD
jgi:uncharacterized protein